jgi:transposase-like protein
MKKTRIIRYSESFKLELVKEYEEGSSTIVDLQRKYDIRGATTIKNWLKKYGRADIVPKIIRVEKPGEQDQLKKLKKENQQLKEAMADLHVENVINKNALIATAEQMGLSVDELKKKLGVE